jgi:hypothetical protein
VSDLCAESDVLDVDLDGLLRSPTHFPLRLSLADDLLTLVRLRRLDYRCASFLDPRGLPDGALMWQARLSELHDALATPDPAPRLAYLFHTGFCCSTLLSRCAEISPAVFALREPMSLHNLEVQWAGAGRDWSREQCDVALATLMVLLGRTWSERQTALIKADCTLLVPALLQHSSAPYVVLYCPVGDFVAAVMSCSARRAWSIGRLRQMIETARAIGMLVPFEIPAELNAPEAACLIWWWQMWIFREAHKKYRGRGYFLSAEAFLGEPAASLRTLFELLDAAYPAAGLPALAARVMSRDAKTPAQRADAASRRQKLAAATSVHAEQIDRALQWASRWVGGDFQMIGAAAVGEH